MTAALRYKQGPRGSDLWKGPNKRNLAIEIPDIITFVTSPNFLDRPLYPRQATVLKIIFLRTDLLTEYDLRVIAEWEDKFSRTKGYGLVPGTVARMERLRAEGYKWFRELIFVMGRRGGKGYICAAAIAYVIWRYLATGNPQEHYHIDRDKRLEAQIFAGKKDQARDNLFRDVFNMIQGAPCFEEYVAKPLGESMSIFAPNDFKKIERLTERGITSAMDLASFRILPLPAVPMAGRGQASIIVGFDEMGHMIAAGANRSAEEIYRAAKPAIDQIGKDTLIVCPSSPFEMIGKFYELWQFSQEIDEATKEFVYPEIFMLQLPSWDIYTDWELTNPEYSDEPFELFPEEYAHTRITDVERWGFNPYWTGAVEPPPLPLPMLTPLMKPVIEYDELMKREERADPEGFSVERLAQWQTALDHYLDPARIAEMFETGTEMGLSLPPRANGPDKTPFRVGAGVLSMRYKGHADPSLVNDNFAVAVAHLEQNEDGYDVVIFDYIHHWVPAEWPNHTIDYTKINEYLWDLIKGYPIDHFTFDQYQSQYFIADFTQRARQPGLHKRIEIGLVPSTAPYNLSVAENFKIALNQGWVIAPYYEEADLELQFLQFKNNKVMHPTAGPVQHDDVARCMMECVYDLLNNQVAGFLMKSVSMTVGMQGGVTPWMTQPTDAHDVDVLGQFSAKRRTKTGVGPMNPTRGRPGITPGRGPLPRTPGRLPGYRGR